MLGQREVAVLPSREPGSEQVQPAAHLELGDALLLILETTGVGPRHLRVEVDDGRRLGAQQRRRR